MKSIAVVWPAVNQVELHDIVVPEPGHGELLLEAAFTQISPGTERNWLTGRNPLSVVGFSFPFRPGYAFAGRVKAVGLGVTRFKPGDPVATAGSPFGSHAAHVIAREADVAPVPDGVALDSAVFSTLAGVAQHGVHLARPELGEPVAVVGLGPIGLLAVGMLRLAGGAPVLAIDPVASRRERALAFGADMAIDPGDERGLAEALARMSGGGPAAVIELTAQRDPLQLALRIARPWGRVVQLSSVAGESSLDLMHGLHVKAVQLIGGFVGMRPRAESSPGRWTEADDREAFLRLLQYRRLDVQPLVTHRFDARRAPEAYEGIKAGDPSMIGVLLEWK
ncbi:MAG: zinc-binding alcohol dehydrogenase [Steroidobacteraceae bacterium]